MAAPRTDARYDRGRIEAVPHGTHSGGSARGRARSYRGHSGRCSELGGVFGSDLQPVIDPDVKRGREGVQVGVYEGLQA